MGVEGYDAGDKIKLKGTLVADYAATSFSRFVSCDEVLGIDDVESCFILYDTGAAVLVSGILRKGAILAEYHCGIILSESLRSLLAGVTVGTVAAFVARRLIALEYLF